MTLPVQAQRWFNMLEVSLLQGDQQVRRQQCKQIVVVTGASSGIGRALALFSSAQPGIESA